MTAERNITWVIYCDADGCTASHEIPSFARLSMARQLNAPGWTFEKGYTVGPLTALLTKERSRLDADYCPQHSPQPAAGVAP